MGTRPFVLLTNDDGIDAPGLAALCAAFAPIAEIEIVAPHRECSAVGHGVSVRRDMTYRCVTLDGGARAHVLHGLPADCVKLALTRLLGRKPDLLIAGVNPGANIGNNVLYSGTVAAALEGAMFGVPGIAVSVQYQPGAAVIHYEPAAQFATRLAALVLERGLPAGLILNANLPNLPAEEIRGVVVSRQGKCMYVDDMEPVIENGAVQAYRNMGHALAPSGEGEDLDDVVLRAKKISITPLHYDMTRHDFRSELRRWVNEETPAGLQFGKERDNDGSV